MSQFEPRPQPPKSHILAESYTILSGAYDAASSFLTLFENTRRNRGAEGASTDEEQDLLRAMLVFACAGLDSMIKQVVRDALETVIDKNSGAHENFRIFVEKRLAKQGTFDPKFLARVLTEMDPRKVLIEELVGELTSQSLQSKDQVLRTASYFDIPTKDLVSDIDQLDQVFRSRNQISHEMDVDLNQTNRNRRPRQKNVMIDYTKVILEVTRIFLVNVDQRLQFESVSEDEGASAVPTEARTAI